MEQSRARVDAVVTDPKTAAALKPYYPYGCKRPTFHDEFLPAFNLPHVTLVDTAPLGVKRITPAGVVHDRSEEHTSELQSLMRISYAVFCLKNKSNHPSSKRHHTTATN